jgi:2,4-dienoyl-CoA reductase-like NADH-dependent reductase (Old Yellow Enzyme family)
MTESHKPPPRVASLKSIEAFQAHLDSLPIPIQCDGELLPPGRNPLAREAQIAGRRVGNRFAVQPMEGWDGTPGGRPSDLTVRRWQNFGTSGAKLIWGGEALAVRPDGRANPHQLTYSPENSAELAGLLTALKTAHRERHGTADDLLTGLQLTHSGRYCRPGPGPGLLPRIAYRHPVLDGWSGLADEAVANKAIMSNDELDDLVQDFVTVAVFAREAGFDFVDIKHCHGYLLHELLSAHTRPGRYGGSFENRTRLLREIVAGIRRDAPGLMIGVRLSAYDFSPFTQPPEGAPPRGVPVPLEGLLPYRFGFGLNPNHPLETDPEEPIAFLKLCRELDIPLVNITAGSPYYTPHIQRPALFPPSGGYPPPEDPLLGCARLLQMTATLKRAVPEIHLVGTGYTYFQDYLPLVAQTQVRLGHVDSVGLGRMMLSYPELPADVLAGRPLQRSKICRTFSDCTTGPRRGMVSGCFPLDPFYKARPEATEIKKIKAAKSR